VRYPVCDRSRIKIRGFRCAIPSRGLQNTRQPRGRLQGRSYRRRDDHPHRSICERAEKISRWTWRGQRHADPTGVRREASTRGLGPLPRQELQSGPTPERAELWKRNAAQLAAPTPDDDSQRRTSKPLLKPELKAPPQHSFEASNCRTSESRANTSAVINPARTNHRTRSTGLAGSESATTVIFRRQANRAP
jgi:hypothetical protein